MHFFSCYKHFFRVYFISLVCQFVNWKRNEETGCNHFFLNCSIKNYVHHISTKSPLKLYDNFIIFFSSTLTSIKCISLILGLYSFVWYIQILEFFRLFLIFFDQTFTICIFFVIFLFFDLILNTFITIIRIALID